MHIVFYYITEERIQTNRPQTVQQSVTIYSGRSWGPMINRFASRESLMKMKIQNKYFPIPQFIPWLKYGPEHTDFGQFTLMYTKVLLRMLIYFFYRDNLMRRSREWFICQKFYFKTNHIAYYGCVVHRLCGNGKKCLKTYYVWRARCEDQILYLVAITRSGPNPR